MPSQPNAKVSLLPEGPLSAKPTVCCAMCKALHSDPNLPLCMGLIWVAFDRRKHGFHDKLANTVVIDDDDDELS